MKDLAVLQARYQRDESAIQLGGLASNLDRIAWHAQRAEREASAWLFRESKYFTEWAAASCSLEQCELLAQLQVELALWERGWGVQYQPLTIANEAQAWSRRLLAASGLL